jgi:hypothetical protein
VASGVWIAVGHLQPFTMRYFTSSDVGWLQSPSPVLVAARYRNITVAPGVSPETVVLVCSVDAEVTHVLPPSVLYRHTGRA